MMQCPKCNQMTPDDSVFCERCGASLKEETQVSQAAFTPQMMEASLYTGEFAPFEAVSVKTKKAIDKKMVFVIAGGVLMVIALIAVTILYFSNVNKLNGTIQEQKQTIEDLNAAITDKNGRIEELEEDVAYWQLQSASYEIGYDFLIDNIAFVCDDYYSAYYHKYTCSTFQTCESYWAYNIEAARGDGYRPCPDCY